jgi:ethanolamine phosphate transferase 2 subunit G
MRNARQILDIMLAVFGQEIFESESNSDTLTESKAAYQDLAHGWKSLVDSYGKSVDGEAASEFIPAATTVRCGRTERRPFC